MSADSAENFKALIRNLRTGKAHRLSWKMSWMRLSGQLMNQRKALGLTQDEAAERLKVSRSTFQRWERGDAVPDALQLFRWADALGIAIHSEVQPTSVNSDAS